MEIPYGIHWFRRDLRIAGNPALQKNFRAMKGRVLGLFSFDSTFLSRLDFSPNRFQFFLHTLQALQAEIHEQGGELKVFDKNPATLFSELLMALREQGLALPSLITFNRDYEPFARARDALVTKTIQSFGVEVQTERDHVLIEPEEIIKESDPISNYQVFSAYQKQWLKAFKTSGVQERLAQQKKGFAYLGRNSTQKIFQLDWEKILRSKISYPDCLSKFISVNEKKVSIPLPKAGTLAALENLKIFSKKIETYEIDRNIPSLNGTSRLSLYFKNGSFTISQAIAYLDLSPINHFKFLSELIWREFYYYILYKNPRVENESFLEKYKNISWENRKDFFEAWKEGRTGFPIVDAGMRELYTTGWMHNRVRMIVASFLTKDLLVDWRWGEKHFMNQLLDGDLAPNNGGWQWAASTGCDAQPYFRIFNPFLQSQRFDPEALYIKKFVPELNDLSPKEIHSPLCRKVRDYPLPIVDHAEQKSKALALYKIN